MIDTPRDEYPRILLGLPNAAYHAGPGLSHSGVKRILRTPWHFQALREEHEAHPSTPTAAMVAGTLAHCATLEPDEFAKRYAIGPDVSTKAAREWKAFTAALPPGVEPITQAQADIARAQAASLRGQPILAGLLAKGDPEVSVFWRDGATRTLCKARPDWVHYCGTTQRPAVILVDVKTTTDASPEGFAKAAGNFGYHTQADWYCDGYTQATGVACEGMVFAVVESEFPYASAVYMLGDESLRVARERNRRALNLYVHCTQAKHWPGYSTEVQVIDVSRWALQAEAA